MPGGIDIGGLISGFDQARRTYRDAELKTAQAREDKEFSLLQALAQHMDPEIAAVGASALLGMVGGGGPKMRKGFSGFMGEVEKTGYMDPLQRFLGAGATSAQPEPGSAAQPDTALIEPEAQRATGGTAPTFGAAAPAAPTGQDITPPQLGAPAGPSVGGATPPEFGGGPAGPGGLGMPPPGPPPPETPMARSKRLFPSASDIAAETTYRNLKSRLDAVMQAIAAAKTEDERDLVRGIAGAPRARTAAKPMNAQYRDAAGQELEGTVIFDPQTGVAEVDGQPVTILKMLPTNGPRPIGVNVAGANGTVNRRFIDPNNPNAAPLAEVETGLQAPAGPAPYSGTVTTDEGVFRLPRGGGEGVRLGDAPPRAGELSQEQQQATGWLADVNTEVKAALSSFNQNRPSGMKSTALGAAQQNEIVKRITKGRYKTVGELTAATKRAAQDDGGGDSGMRGRANRVRQRLEGAQPSRVQGAGLPPGM